MIECQVTIVGAGLSGLYMARHFQQIGVDYRLVEARNRLGGRIAAYEFRSEQGEVFPFDIGPSWFWPEYQREIIHLLEELKLSFFNQYTLGEMLYESKDSGVSRYPATSPMQDSFRIEGGTSRLTQILANHISEHRVLLKTAIKHIDIRPQQKIFLSIDRQAEPIIKTQHLILALPPRLIAKNFSFTPPLPTQIVSDFTQTPTWMAGQAKILAIYKSPFWREKGLSGEVFSQVGPLTEIHDASYSDNGPYALFGFVGLAPQTRSNMSEKALLEQAKQQLIHLFGAVAASPLQMVFKDWSTSLHTSTQDDLNVLTEHPGYGMSAIVEQLAKQRVYLAGTEVADTHGGYMEGALVAARRVIRRIFPDAH